MRTLVHLSDLHFGRVDPQLLDPLVESVTQAAPDVVVVSGDLTQRARSREFQAARQFLDRLPSPRIVVPGNHDVPLYNVVDRLLRPLAKFRSSIEENLQPSYVDNEVAVLGINTARSLVIKNGRVNAAQMAHLQDALCSLDEDVVRVVVTHHPFDVRPGDDARNVVGRAVRAMAVFARCRADVLLAGHLHTSHSGGSGARYAIAGYEALVVSAGTATSTRARGETNTFNVLRIDNPRVAVERFEWTPDRGAFEKVESRLFVRDNGAWRPAAG